MRLCDIFRIRDVGLHLLVYNTQFNLRLNQILLSHSPAVEEVYLAPEYICHFFLDSLSTGSSDFKSAGCRVGKFGQFDI